MCKWGTNEKVKLAYPRPISKVTEVDVDKCIAKVIQKLNDEKIHTMGCCCGHNKENPCVTIKEDYYPKDIERILEIIKSVDNRNWEIYQWRLRIVGRSSNGVIDEIVPDHLWYNEKFLKEKENVQNISR